MTVEQLIVAIVGVLTTGGGGKLLASWLDRRQKRQHEHEIELAARFERMQQAFTAELGRFHEREERRDEREEERRRQHLSDMQKSTEANRELALRLSDLTYRLKADSKRPPPESKA